MREGDAPAVLVHTLTQAETALRAAASAGRPIALWSAPGASAYGGVGWFRALTGQAREAVPEAVAEAVLDCGDRPGDVLAALRDGFAAIRYHGKADAAVADIAAQYGARIYRAAPKALDLQAIEDRGDDLRQACHAWLEQGDGPGC